MSFNISNNNEIFERSFSDLEEFPLDSLFLPHHLNQIEIHSREESEYLENNYISSNLHIENLLSLYPELNHSITQNNGHSGSYTNVTRRDYLFNVYRASGLRGRKTSRNSSTKRTHNKYSLDNILRFLQTYGINFIQEFINLVLKKLGINENFYKIEYAFKRDMNNDSFSKFRNYTLGDILRSKISPKFRTKDKYSNYITYNKLKNEPVISNLLQENYLKFFNEIFCKNDRIISLKQYGANITIEIPDHVNMYIDLEKQNKIDYEYIQNLKECINKYYKSNYISN
jgi:hypothetical protein